MIKLKINRSCLECQTSMKPMSVVVNATIVTMLPSDTQEYCAKCQQYQRFEVTYDGEQVS